MRRRPTKDEDEREDAGMFGADVPIPTESQGLVQSTPQVREVEDFLPPTIDDGYICKKCYASDGCMLYRKVNNLTWFKCSRQSVFTDTLTPVGC